MGVQLGKDAKFYRNVSPGTWGAPTWNEVSNIADLDMSQETAVADTSTRGSGGYRSSKATLKDATISYQMKWNSGDADFIAVRDAFNDGTTLIVAVADADITVPGTQYFKAEVMVTNFSISQPLEDAITVDVEMKPDTGNLNVPDWFDVT